jgi:hypothetical protein
MGRKMTVPTSPPWRARFPAPPHRQPNRHWGADGSRDPFWWSGGGGLRLAATFATLGANGLHIHQLVPQSRAQMGELRTAWARAARVDADASMSRGTAIRTARRAAEATAEEEEAAEEEAAAEEEELLLGFI